MAFGITPKHIQETTFTDIDQNQILPIALEAATKLNWKIGHTSETGFLAYTQFSMSSWSEEVSFRIDGQKATIKSECTGSQLTDWGKNKKNVEEFLQEFERVRVTLSPEDISAKELELKTKIESQPVHNVVNQKPQNSDSKIKNLFSLFIPTEGYFITPILLNINIVVFILMLISGVDVFAPDAESLIYWGANLRPSTLSGEWWRLLTCCFIHIGVIHLLMNAYALVYIGFLLEPHLGRTRFLAAYLLTGICGSVASLYWHELTISAGASGAIFGMYGVFLAMLTTNFIEKSARTTFLTSILVFVGYNLLNGLKAGIDNAAHIGGLASGLLIGYAYYPSLLKPSENSLKYLTTALLTAFIMLASFFVYQQIPNDIPKYDQKMEKFVSMESMALEVYGKGENASREELMEEIKDRGIYYWRESIKVLNEADKLEIPEELHAKNKKLIEYCKLRIACYELMYKTVDEGTDNYQNQIKDYHTQIEAMIKELKGEN